MRWPAAILVLLLACALSKWLLATDIQIQDPLLAGMPLSDAEYDHFFKTLNGPRRVSAVCFLRAMYGCQNALIQTLDLYENHGIVPEGPVCSDLAEMPTFPDFCTLTFYRCTLKKYFVKRVQCPDEINKTPATTQNTNQEPGNIESPSTLQKTSIFPTTVPTTRTSPALLISASNTPSAATEAITMTVSAVTSSRKPSLALEPTSTTTDSESLLELLTGLDAVIAEQSFPELFTTNSTTPTTTEEYFPQDITVLTTMPSLSPVATLPSTSHALTAAPVTSVSIVTVSSSEPATTEVATSPTGTTPTTTDETFSQHLTVWAALPSPSPAPTLPSTSHAMTAAPVTSVSIATVSSSEPATTEVATSPTGTTPTTTDETFSQHLTVLATLPSPSPAPTLPSTSHAMTAAPVTSVSVVTVSSSDPATAEVATLSVGSIPTNPTTVAPASSLTTAPPSPTITVTAPLAPSSKQPCSAPHFSSSSTVSKLSVLLMKPSTTKTPAHLSPPASVAHWPVLPMSALFEPYPLQSTSIMQLFILPSGFGPRKLKPQGAIAISPLLPSAAGSANTWQKKKIPEPQMNTPATAKLEDFFLRMNSPTTAKLDNFFLQMNSPTTAKLDNFFLRLKDGRVQQLMQKMRELMTKGKAVKKQLLQSTSLQLLSALKHARQKKSMVSLVSKNQLQR